MNVEEPDDPPVQPGQQCIGVQCWSSKADEAAQMGRAASNAVVQWPADLQYPVTTDHIYAGKYEIHFNKQVEEDNQSQYLFFSADEPSEESQSQYRQFDPEYIASQSEPSQSSQESHASAETHKEDRLFLVYEEQLKQLLQHCLKCGSLIAKEDEKELQNEGSQLTLELTCANGCSYRWQS